MLYLGVPNFDYGVAGRNYGLLLHQISGPILTHYCRSAHSRSSGRLFIPSLHKKMFMDSSISLDQFQSGEVDMTDVNTNARASMWEHLENKFYVGHEMIGSGTGSVQNYMYNNFILADLKSLIATLYRCGVIMA